MSSENMASPYYGTLEDMIKHLYSYDDRNLNIKVFTQSREEEYEAVFVGPDIYDEVMDDLDMWYDNCGGADDCLTIRRL